MTPKYLIALATAALLAAAVPALAQNAAPTPGCAGSYSDKKGDAEPENVDITAFWFDYAAGKTYANMQVANLTKDLPPEATGVNWYILWNLDDAQHFVTAQIEVPQSEPTFGYGTVEETPNGYLRQQGGDTAGQFFEGPNGVIRWEVPAEVGGTSGKILKTTLADTKASLGIPGVVSSLQDLDEATGKQYTVNGCAATQPPAEPLPPAPTTPGATPEAKREVATGKLAVTVSKRVPKASKVRRTLSLKVSGNASEIDAGLFRGSPSKRKVVAKGRLTKLAGKGTLKLKVSKKVKKGAYTLYLVGKNGDGTVADKTVKLRFK